MSARRLAAALCALLLASTTASAQVVAGSISGTTIDAQGGVVPGVNIVIVNESTLEERSTVTNDRGEFQLTNLMPGRYTVRATLESFRTHERQNVVLSAGERLSVGNVTMDVGAVGETVVVEARGAHVNVAETQHAGVITANQIEQVQVLGRDVTSIMRLLPGVRYEQTVDSLGMSFGTDVPNVGGARRDWSNVVVDGLVANEAGNSGLMSQQINLDAIAEVRVLLNTYRAEYGRAGGGQVQIVSKAGGANYRGNLYYYGRHESLNANDFFRNRQGVAKPPLPVQHLRRQPGWSGAQGEEPLLLLLAGSAAGETPRSTAQLDDADRRRDAWRLLADPGQPGTVDQHPRPAA